MSWSGVFFLLLLTLPVPIDSKVVEWIVRTDPIELGRDVDIFCSSDDASTNDVWQWKNGSTLLIINEMSINKTKYVGSVERDGFLVRIKQFNVDDLRRTYSCLHGFDKYTANLTTSNYQWYPKRDTYEVNANSTTRSLKIGISIPKVYPVPTCTSSIGEQPIFAKLNNKIENVEEYFFAVHMTLEYQFSPFDCGENISVLCMFGDKPEKFTYITTRKCKAVCQHHSPCVNNGTCLSNNTHIYCDCPYGYYGNKCENATNTTVTVADTDSVHGGIIAVIVILILGFAVIGLLLLMRRKLGLRNRQNNDYHLQQEERLNGNL